MPEPEVKVGPLARTLLYAPDELGLELRRWCMNVEERRALAERMRAVAHVLELDAEPELGA